MNKCSKCNSTNVYSTIEDYKARELIYSAIGGIMAGMISMVFPGPVTVEKGCFKLIHKTCLDCGYTWDIEVK